jgi:hypothetical protein
MLSFTRNHSNGDSFSSRSSNNSFGSKAAVPLAYSPPRPKEAAKAPAAVKAAADCNSSRSSSDTDTSTDHKVHVVPAATLDLSARVPI